MSLSFVLNFFYSQLFVTPPYPSKQFTGQTVIVTGSNTGLGFEAAQHFVRLGAAKVILAVRTVEKGEAAKKRIEENTKRTSVVEVWQLELESYESVKAFAGKARGLDRLDVVVENAGIDLEKFRLAGEDEATVTVNVTSTFLLALLLLPKMQETSAKYNVLPRLTIVTSDLHFVTPFNERNADSIFDELNRKETTVMSKRYADQSNQVTNTFRMSVDMIIPQVSPYEAPRSPGRSRVSQPHHFVIKATGDCQLRDTGSLSFGLRA